MYIYIDMIIFFFSFQFLIEFIGVTLVHKTIQVSSVQLNKAKSSHGILCPSPQAKSLSIHIFSLFALLHLLPPPSGCHHSPHCCLCVCIYVFWLIPSFFYPAPHSPTALTAVSPFYVSMLLCLLYSSLKRH